MARSVKDPDERRREMIACAQKLFYSKGYERTTVGDIVDELDVAKGTFYYYFDSKLAVLEAMVDEVLSQSVALLHEIVADQTLLVLEKWAQAFQMMFAWKAERRAEIVAILHAMQMDENMVLQNKVRTRTLQILSPEFARIVGQGVEAGVFQTEFVEESAVITLSIMQCLSDALYGILLSPDNHENPVALALRKIAAVETAVERVLGAPPGSLSLVDDQAIAAWIQA